MIGSTAQRQSEYQQRLKLINPELLRERERRKWHRRQMRTRLTSHSSTLRNTVEASPFAIGMKHQDIRNYNNRLQPDDVKRLNSVKYPIHDLLRWLENVEVNDKVKYRFLKYLYNEQDALPECRNGGIDAYNSFIHQKTDASQRERYSTQDLQRRRDINDKTRMSVESLAPASGVLSKHRHHENAERIVTPRCRKAGKKIRGKTSKKTTKRENRSE